MNARFFEELRPVGFAVAYRMLGSVSEAEDIVQEAFLRLHHTLQDGERSASVATCNGSPMLWAIRPGPTRH